MKYRVEGDVLQAVVDYLATKPYSEVYQLIGALQQSAPVEEKSDDD